MCNLRNSFNLFEILSDNNLKAKGRCNRGRMVVGFITTYVISAYHHYRCECESSSGEVYSIQHYVIKFVSDLRYVTFKNISAASWRSVLLVEETSVPGENHRPVASH